MKLERFARLEQLFAELCDAPTERRTTSLAELRAAEPDLADELERMLAADARPASSRLEAIDAGIARLAADAADATPLPGSIGPFRVVARLGSGGMGDVYRAEQDRPRRMVAVKLLRMAGASTQALRRFALEAELLGRLQHPGIAQVFAAGTTTIDGRLQPWIALELIDGAPLSAWARAARPGLRARLELLARIADAVHHAHQKGIVHRDLKSANILVTPAGEPKLVDFGIARVVDAGERSSSMATQAGQMLGTLASMSPEQLRGGDAVDTRADVWALGVVAFELLTGRLPFAVDGRPVAEAARAIAEAEPPRLGALDRALRGDVETIVAHALEKEPARRYASAHEFGQDLRRHLDHQPIAARPQSAAYQLAKFTRRHRGLVAGLAIAAAALLAAAIGMSVLAVESRVRQRTAETVAGILDGLIAAPDPWANGSAAGRDVTVVDALGRAEAGLDAAIHGDRAVEASVRTTLGSTWLNLGELPRARAHLERAASLWRELARDDEPAAARTLVLLAMLENQSGRPTEAETAARAAREQATRRLGAADPLTLEATAALVHALRSQSRFDEALTVARDARDVAVAKLGPDDAATLRAEHNLASMQLASGDLAAAEAALRENAERRVRALGQDHPATVQSRQSHAEALWRLGRREEAEPIARACHESRRRVLGEAHPYTLASAHGLAVVLASVGKVDEAMVLRDRLIADATATLGATDPLVLRARFSRILLLQHERRLEDAERECLVLLEADRAAAPENLPDVLNLLGTLRVDQQRAAEAVPAFEEALDRCELPERHWQRALFRANYGNALRLAGRIEEARPELEAAVEDLEAALGAEHDDTQYALAKLVVLLEAANEREEAARQRARLTATGRAHAR